MPAPHAASHAALDRLPPGYRGAQELARRDGVRVVRAVGPAGRDTVLRLERGAAAQAEALAELAVLAAVDHPGLARLEDFGALAGGGRFTARGWIEGATLDAWAVGRTPEEVGGLVARLCAGLAHLHARGFVHGDLKPANVLVRSDGAPVLVDFGLAGRRGDAVGASGTLVALAPERIAGAPLEPPADLFALGALLVELLHGRPDPGAFYAAFPRRPFLAAAGVEASELPEWARDLVERLTARDPDERPAGAEEVARTLATRLGVEASSSMAEPVFDVPIQLGRERCVERLATALADERPACLWAALDCAEDVEPFARRVRLVTALGRTTCDGLSLARTQRDERPDPRSLERWALRCVEAGDAPLVVAASGDDAWERRRAETLARSARQAGRSVVVVAVGPPRDRALHTLEVPGASRAAIADYVGERIDAPADDDAFQGLVDHLVEAAQGSLVRLQRALEALVRAGAFLSTGARPRLRSGSLPTAAASSSVPRDLDASDGALLLAVALAPVPTLASIAAVAGLDARAAATRLAELEARGVVQREGTVRFATRVALAPLVERVGRDAVRAALARLGARGAVFDPADDPAAIEGAANEPDPIEHSSIEALAADEATNDGVAATALLDALAKALDANAPELVLSRLDRLERLVPIAEPLCARVRGALRALAWVALGQLDRADAALDGIDHEDDRDRSLAAALAARARGQVAQRRGQPEAALAHFARAARADPRGQPDAEVARLHQLFELRRHDEVIARAAELESQGVLADDGWPVSRRANVRSLDALAHFARGEAEAARARLADLVRSLRDEPATRAAVLLNLATVERRVRGADHALGHLREAVALFDAVARPVEAAQARTALASALRDAGELVTAESELEDACATRERLGDHGGAALARGTLGLVLAERGHLVRALAEIDAAQRDLGDVARRRHGPLLAARALELRARLGRDVDLVAKADTAEDPRQFLYLARAAYLTAARDVGDELVERAVALARRLELHPVVAEARTVRALVDRAVDVEVGAGAEPDSVRTHVDVLVARHVFRVARAGDGRALLAELVRSGRDDRAARLALALAREGSSDVDPLLDVARRCLARCEAGVTRREVVAARRALLGVPDPRPDDFDALSDSESFQEVDDMELLSILEINRLLVSREDTCELLGEIVEQALRVTGGERGFLVLETAGELEFDTAVDSARGDIPRPHIEVSTSVVRAALERGEVLRVSNAAEEPGLRAAPSVVELDLRSILCAPFDVDENSRGAIYVDHRLHAAAFGPRAERLLGLLADQAALAIRQVARLDEIRRLNERLEERVSRQQTDLETARRSLRAAGLPAPAGGLVGESARMQAVRSLLERVATSDLSVLVHGASGTGKELAARALHELSERRQGPFVSENCASLPESLIESELFGYEKGAFTGADRAREGLFERANGGTLFLDEIGEMPGELQSKLLRALETREIRRLGDDRARPVDVRLVTATNRDLAAEVREKRFREDLYYRIAGMAVEMPALDERIEDIGSLVHHFLDAMERRDGTHREIAPAVIARLARRTWPGNVRELRNEVARLCVLSEGDITDPELVSMPGPTAARGSASLGGELRTFAEIERSAILETLERVGGDKRRAAKVLGISLSKLYERLKKWREEGLDEA